MNKNYQVERADLVQYRNVINDNIKKINEQISNYKKEKSTPLYKRILKDLNILLANHKDVLTKTNNRINLISKKNPDISKPDNNELVKLALKAYEGFHHRKDGKVKSDTIDYPEVLVFIGDGKRLYYTSDKRLYGDEKLRDYYHVFKKHGEIYAGIKLGKDKKPYVDMYIIKNLNTRVKPEGIVG